ncbi:MAG: class I SAM-dependent methyltransferase [Bacteroidales bacterium]|nr:class I SAM-dependent methyltransferase [Bacteroidales bacterium]MBN2756494.1 class I SAM-dependent methyltransferase [Bacteroidales bacterium]
MSNINKFKIQELQYNFPYHYLVDFENFKSFKNLNWGIEYYAYINKVKELILDIDYKNHLDIGCGDGKLISIISKLNKEKQHFGYDLSEPAILLAKALNFNRKNATFVNGDFAEAEFEFDLITLIEVLEHIPDAEIENFVENIYKKLKPGGKLIVSLPSINVFPVKAKHYRHYSLEMIKNSFSKFKFEKAYFLVKKGFIFKANAIFSTLFPYSIMNKLQLKFAKKTLFTANQNNCRHIICEFTKEN